MADPDSPPVGTLRLEGRLIGPDGAPVANADVWIRSDVRTTQTDHAGAFAFEGLHCGRYTLRARFEERIGGREGLWLTSGSEPVVLRIGEATAVRVTVCDAARRAIAGARVRIATEAMTATTDANGEVRLGPLNPDQYAIEVTAAGYAPGRVLAQSGSVGAIGIASITLHRGYSIAGRVVDEQGKAIAAARVFATTSPHLSADTSELATSDADGAFAIPAVESGPQWLHAVDGTHAPSTTSLVEIEQDLNGVEIVMKPGRSLTGNVVDPDGAPVPFAQVSLVLPHAERLSTDLHGVFELRGLPPASYHVHAEGSSGVSRPQLVDLARDACDAKLVLEPVGHAISGVVVDDTGAPLPYVTVTAVSSGVQSSGNTDAIGRFSIAGLRPGECMLWADRFGRAPSQRPHWITASTGDTGVRLTLARPGAITGRVAFADGSAPRSFTLRGIVWDVHGEHGAFEIRDLAPGDFTLSISGGGFVEAKTESIRVEPGKTTELVVTLQRGRTVVGVVVDAAGHLVPGARVVCGLVPFADLGNDDEHQPRYRATTADADGAFSIAAVSWDTTLGPSQLFLGADHPIHGRSLPVDIPEGDEGPPASLVLLPCGSIYGRVTQADQPVAGAIIGCGWPEFASAITDHDGAFLMPRLPEGAFILRTILPTELMRSHHTPVQVVGGQRAALTIDVPVGTVTLAVAVQPRPGRRVATAELALFAGAVSFANREQLTAKLLTDGQGFQRWRDNATDPVVFYERFVPGHYTLCVVPLAGDPDDLAFEQRLREHGDEIAVFCTPVHIEAAPSMQSVTLQMPDLAL